MKRLVKPIHFAIVAAIILGMLLNMFKPQPGQYAQAATYTFSQSNWTTASSTAVDTHDNNTNNPGAWNYYVASSSVKIIPGTGIQLATTSQSITQTDDGTTNTGFNLAGATTTASTNISGSGNSASVILATAVSAGVAQIASGFNHSCAVSASGNIYCWGGNTAGQLGNNSFLATSTPVQVLKGAAASGDYSGNYLANIKSVALGALETCAVSNGGSVYCWGSGNWGVLGNTAAVSSTSTPVQVLKGAAASGDYSGNYLANIKSVSVSVDFACALSNSGYVYCWGHGDWGNMGNGQSGSNLTISTPVQVLKGAAASGDYSGNYLANIKSVSVGGTYFACSVSNGGNVYCWGQNSTGQLGNNTQTNASTPVQVLKGAAASGDYGGNYLANIKSVADGNLHTCAVANSGNIYCWGEDQYGQLGNGVDGWVGPYWVPPDMECCDESCDGYCDFGSYWTNGSYETKPYLTPVQVLKGGAASGDYSGSYLSNTMSVAGGGSHTCAVSNNTNAYCWGGGSTGQIGDGTTTTVRSSPIQVLKGGAASGDYSGSYLSNTMSVAGGGSHTCAVSTNNNAYCWGSGGAGQLGNHSWSDASTTVRVHGVNNSGNLDLAATTVYYSSGTYTSGPLDLGGVAGWGTISWTSSTLAGQNIAIKARSSNNSSFTGADDWISTCTNITSGAALSAGNCVHNGDRYIQYQATLTTGDTSASPSLNDVTINYYKYNSLGTVTSTPYNTQDSGSAVGQVLWTEGTSLPSGTGVTISIHASSTVAKATSSVWTDLTNSTSGCSKNGSTGVVTCSGTAIPSGMRDGVGDQFFQYKVTVSSTGANTPTVSQLQVKYSINAAPQVQNVSATPNSDGTVTINYRVLDTDTASGTSPGYVTTTFQYCPNGNLSSCATYPLSAFPAGTGDNSVNMDGLTWTSYIATWTPATDLGTAIYDANATIKVLANDHEAANNLGSATSSAYFVLDTTPPSGNSIVVTASTSPTAYLTLASTDNSAVQMKVSLDSGLAGASWVPFTSTSAISIGGNNPATVYARFKDAYGNTSGIISATTPDTPASCMVQDNSNILNGATDYRLFLAWKKVNAPGPGFGSYKLYRSTDQSSWPLLATITDINTNYFTDTSTAADTIYYYKIVSTDSSGNTSVSSATVNGKANGVQDAGEGGGGVAPSAAPVISNVATSSPSPTSITITWDTDVLSNSVVGYSTSSGNFTDNSITISTMVNNSSSIGAHTLVLTSLTPGQTYYFQVQSTNVSSVSSTDSNGGNGYVFTTPAGTTISNVANPQVNNTSAKITWNTSGGATAYVIYSPNSNFLSPITTGTDQLATSHTVNLAGLTAATRYYYYVYSVDISNVTTTDKNIINGTANYYSFNTTNDLTAPVIVGNISSTTLTNSAIITWTTDKSSDSQVEYGSTGSYGSTTTLDSLQTLTHSVTINSLTNGTLYHFRVRSRDANGNLVTSGDKTFVTQVQPDTDAPVISNIATSTITLSSATIAWHTSENANALVEYGTNPVSYSSLTGDASDYSSSDHAVTLSNLSGGTTYYFRVKSQDVSGNTASSTRYSFTTSADNTPPNFSSGPTALVSGNAAVITWNTNEAADTQVAYGLATNSYNTSSTLDTTSTLTHAVNLTNLSLNTNYYYRAYSRDAAGNLGISGEHSFVTPLVGDTTAPVISGIATSSISLTGATISWNTDENANALVEYGTSQNSYSSLTGNASDFTTSSHSVALTGLSGTTQYYFRVKSQDISGNTANSGQYTFTTTPDITPPTISDTRTALVSDTSAVVTWRTSEDADSEVFYGTDKNNLTTPAISATLVTGHSPTLSGLTKETTYYYKVISKDLATNTATDDNSGAGYTFTTTKEPVTAPPPGGGGSGFVDTTAPSLSNIQAAPGEDSATITWTTSELANSLISYGVSTTYGQIAGDYVEYKDAHSVRIEGLDFARRYHFKVAAFDKSGNLGQSEDLTFTTLKLGGATTTPAEEKTTAAIPDSEIVSTMEKATRQLLEKVLQAIANNPQLKDVTQDVFVKALTEMTDRVVDAPTIVGPKPSVEIQGTTAIIRWSTDKKSSSAAAYARGSDYNPQASNPYTTMAVNPDEFNTSHQVVLSGLDPGTLYHYQVSSKGLIGPEAKSWDNTFTTAAELPVISDLALKKVKDVNLNVSWRTNLPTSATLEYTDLETRQTVSWGHTDLMLVHNHVLKNLDPGTSYELVIKVKDELGNEAQSLPLKFSTGIDLSPPIITNLSSESTLYPGKDSKVQTIISWETDKPATSQVFYQEGVSSGADMIALPEDTSFTQRHIVVITKFKPGTVYKYWVQSKDLSGNIGKSEVFSVLTPQEKQTILDIIINNFEQVFGWTKNLKM